MRPVLAICVAAALISCTHPLRQETGAPGPVIRHANLEVVYNHLLENSREAAELRERRKALDSAPGGGDPAVRSVLAAREEALKKELYGRIRVAVKRVASRQGVDFVLDSSRSLLYAPERDDITADVIRELDLLAVRSEPVSR